MIRVHDVCYKEKGFLLQNIDFELGDGYIMTLLGKNGAGKTTLLDIIYGNLELQKGEIFFDNMKIAGSKSLDVRIGENYFKEVVGYVGEKPWLLEDIAITENLSLFCTLYPNWKEEIFYSILDKIVFSKDKLKETYFNLSAGQKMQLQLAFQLARQPKLLLLDEPLANLDPVAKTDIWDVLSHCCREKEMSIIISTHLVEEINEITDYIGVLKDGRMVSFGERDQLLTEHQCDDIRELVRRLA